jgi:glycosyltransferase involved in cell wall biosynthesis
LKLLEAGTYLKNISISRIKHHRKLGQRYKSEARKMLEPDVIIASHPIVEFSYEAVKYGKENNVPVIVDVRDMWPDIFQDYFPKIFRPFINAATYFMKKKARYAFSSANAVISMSKDVLNWALKVSKLKKFSNSEVFFLSCEKIEGHAISTKKILDIKEKYANKTIISFIGTFGKTYELKTICEAAKAIRIKNPSLLFILAGDGENFRNIEKLSKDAKNIILTGWLNYEECKDLMVITDISLITVSNIAIPNKFGEFLSAGKPVISSASGKIIDLIHTYRVGES